jgi:Icc protein
MIENGIPLRIIQITDTHILSQPGGQLWGMDVDASLHAVLAYLKANHWPVDFATGDLVQDQEVLSYERLKAFLTPLGVPVYCLPGNHDSSRIMREVLNSGPIRRERQVIANNWQIILLDSTLPNSVGGHLSDTELEFLERALRVHPDLHAMVCLHHHPLPVNSPWLDPSLADNGEQLLLLLDRYPQTKAVAWGHIHSAFSTRRGNFHLLAAPSTCVHLKWNYSPFPQGIDGLNFIAMAL